MQGDRELKERILEELRYHPEIYSTEIGVAVSDQVITLMGHVSSFSRKRAAEDAIKHIYGVKAIVNEIKVDLPEIGLISYSKIAISAVAALEDHGLPDEGILITFDEGVATLEGEVESHDLKRLAEICLRNLEGVRAVKNLLSVKNHPFDSPISFPGYVFRQAQDPEHSRRAQG